MRLEKQTTVSVRSLYVFLTRFGPQSKCFLFGHMVIIDSSLSFLMPLATVYHLGIRSCVFDFMELLERHRVLGLV